MVGCYRFRTRKVVVMKFEHGDIVYWAPEGRIHMCDGVPEEFIVLDPKRKYCTLRSLDFYQRGYYYRDLIIELKDLIFVRSEVTE